jgi:hypothetical protein
MEKEVEKNNEALYKQIYEQGLSNEIDKLLKNWNKEKLNALITEPNERTEKVIISDKELLPLLQKPCTRIEQPSLVAHHCDAIKSLTIKTEHCEPPISTFTIEKGITSIWFELTEDKQLLILGIAREDILNENMLTQLKYNTINEKILATLPCDGKVKKSYIQKGHIILNGKVRGKLGYNWFPRKELGKLQIIYQHYLVTIQNKSAHKLFLNATDPSSLTNISPYACVERNTTKKFLISEEQKDHQTVTFPNASNTIGLPINTQKPHFTIKNSGFWDATIVNAISKEEIGQLIYTKHS